ncbi:histidine kinase [Herbiconiux sp. CPCC 205763]|uniref:Histidine kinase n=1 Tax=Herbiconiux aconitum TaxID=2970913 RepID=A0ABT2GP38_9MICO|nr:histidine kinase [Herbiconiux aconitum]MCS5717987.1 histidine kinase [Herbiconiux aconitum]
MTSDTRRTDLARVRALIVSRKARKWYVGSGLALVWLVAVVVTIAERPEPDALRWIGIAQTAVFGAVFMLAPPVSWALPARYKLVPALVLFALTFTVLPTLGWNIAVFWTYVGVAAGMSGIGPRLLVAFVLLLAGLALVAEYQVDPGSGSVWAIPAITVSVSLLMGAFRRQIELIDQLRSTQAELAGLAVQEERSRVARDIHDILGHSLTVITVKAELAGRLLDVDPARAKGEILELEGLARGALGDVRATVSGYRGVSIVSELAGARAALESAGIAAQLPGSADVVPAGDRELFGWVVREGVTNVVRHSGAQHVRVSLGSDFVEVADDGCGPSVGAAGGGSESHGDSGYGDAIGGPPGNGILGLTERAQAAGATLRISRSPEGGYLLRVAR